ncbi:hypothetical protein HanPI659440_Chr00c10g0722211 [Helianthus annuus]|uniref:Uncharacterized protein n=1 Tax=Helianthus annuus TaxID=4232 RepID=A0A9K3DUZ6_HELAN|nr:hypothetical protein HanXRQr2_Chr16g0762761 [Helianthus annuus]KAJ0439141.1 hypothetical protein HanHA300_Chr16g0621961 [Helianthus annuus]KAJ0444132.1 hypothetical protein HanIR_Chr16g0828471 [Helianthus annuus]KAJ0461488.1 hypothetical protein HanHA89_Chr16g0672831 [Helianthus annuus]KAJ0641910.1 hypothetical protein HanLR1_Chr16g0632451 [Helianthus annuus]
MKPLSQRKRVQPSKLTGSYKVCETSATPIYGEEEVLDMVDITMLWLSGGVTGYVDVNKDGILCVHVGWSSDEGINLVMERDYGTDGKLKEVRSKTKVQIRKWS